MQFHVGETDGWKLGLQLGPNVGASLGETVGLETLGCFEGDFVGLEKVGKRVGISEGETDGDFEGIVLGLDTIGKRVGKSDGEMEGCVKEGDIVGIVVGKFEGMTVGKSVGAVVGLVVGRLLHIPETNWSFVFATSVVSSKRRQRPENALKEKTAQSNSLSAKHRV